MQAREDVSQHPAAAGRTLVLFARRVAHVTQVDRTVEGGVARCADHGRSVAFEGLDERSAAFHGRLTGRLG